MTDKRLVIEDTRLLPPGYQTVQVSTISDIRSLLLAAGVLEDTRLLPPDYETVQVSTTIIT